MEGNPPTRDNSPSYKQGLNQVYIIRKRFLFITNKILAFTNYIFAIIFAFLFHFSCALFLYFRQSDPARSLVNPAMKKVVIYLSNFFYLTQDKIIGI